LNPREPKPGGRPVSPVRLFGRPRALWQRFVSKAWWLTGADSQKAFTWVHLAATPRHWGTTAPDLSRIAAHVPSIGRHPTRI
jgi:hypothetical protein